MAVSILPWRMSVVLPSLPCPVLSHAVVVDRSSYSQLLIKYAYCGLVLGMCKTPPFNIAFHFDGSPAGLELKQRMILCSERLWTNSWWMLQVWSSYAWICGAPRSLKTASLGIAHSKISTPQDTKESKGSVLRSKQRDSSKPLSTMTTASAVPPNVPPDLSAQQIPSLPPSFYYIPNFISPAEEAYILQKAGTYTPQYHCSSN
jgi:hypothetical protein